MNLVSFILTGVLIVASDPRTGMAENASASSVPENSKVSTTEERAEKEDGKVFLASSSFDGRYRVMARRLEKDPYGNPVGDRHGYYQIEIEDTLAGIKTAMKEHFLYWHYGRESLREAFHWHPSRHVLLDMSDTARHWHNYQLWEISDTGIQEVKKLSNLHALKQTDAGGDSLNLISVKEEVLDRVQKTHPKTVFNPQNRDQKVQPGTIRIDRMHTGETFERWDGDDIVLNVILDAAIEGDDQKGLAGSVEGRVRFVPANKSQPSHFKVSKIGKLPW